MSMVFVNRTLRQYLHVAQFRQKDLLEGTLIYKCIVPLLYLSLDSLTLKVGLVSMSKGKI